jgi:MoxR-like ATPase
VVRARACRRAPASPLLRAAKAQALLMAGRDYVAPDDVQAILPQTIAHRLVPVGDAGRGPVEQVRAMVERRARWPDG